MASWRLLCTVRNRINLQVTFLETDLLKNTPLGETKTKADTKLADRQLIWVQFKDTVLSKDNQKVLLSERLLQDQHINMEQRILKTSMDCTSSYCRIRNIEIVHQIFHVQGNHWVCATRPANKQVLVYNSSWDEKSLSPILKQFQCATDGICIGNRVQM